MYIWQTIMHLLMYKNIVFIKFSTEREHNRIDNEVNISDEEIDDNNHLEFDHNRDDDISVTDDHNDGNPVDIQSQ